MRHEALYAMVVEDPDDEAARLIYADLLQSRGDPQGEFITVQCELARLGLDGERIFREWIGDDLADDVAQASGRIGHLRRREAALLKKHGAAWGAAVRPHAVKDGVRFRRGFAEHVRWNVSERIEQGIEALAVVAPLLSVLDFASYLRAGSLNARKAFFESPVLGRVRELYPPADAAYFFAGAEHLGSLRRLALGQLRGGELRALERAPFLRSLDAIALNFIGDPSDLARLLASAGPLRELQLIDGSVGPALAAELAGLPCLDVVEIFALRAARLGAGGAARLVRSRAWPALTALDLRKNRLTVADVAALTTLRVLRVLDLGGNPVGNEGLSQLCVEGSFGALRTLRLEKTSISDPGVEALASSPLLGGLRVLDLRKNVITDRGARALATSGATRLRTILLGGNAITDAGKSTLSSAFPAARIYF